MLRHLGFSKTEIDAANDHVCGTMTLEGAPFLKEEHYHVFDCANPCGKKGKRFLSVDSHIYMMAAAQSFISGAISKDDQHAQHGHDRGLPEGLRTPSWSLGHQGQRALTATAQSSASRSPASLVEDDEEAAETLESGTTMEKAQVLAEKDRREGWSSRRSSRPIAKSCPERRKGYTQKAIVGGHKVYLRTGE